MCAAAAAAGGGARCRLSTMRLHLLLVASSASSLPSCNVAVKVADLSREHLLIVAVSFCAL